MPLARQYLMGQSRLLILLQPESNKPFQTMALLCDKQPPNNNGIENFVVLKQVEKWKRSHDFILSFGLIQNHFLIKEFPRPFRNNLSSFFGVGTPCIKACPSQKYPVTFLDSGTCINMMFNECVYLGSYFIMASILLWESQTYYPSRPCG